VSGAGRVLPLLAATAVCLLGTATGAAAQEGPDASDGPTTTGSGSPRVDISFDIGAFDPELDDFAVVAVVVRGETASPASTTVALRGSGGELLWSATVTLTPPSTTIRVDPPVAVGEVASAGLEQAVPLVAAEAFVPPDVFHSGRGGGGSGQLALSLVLIVALVAIVFRTPLPSTSTERWTR
jgi:hypothetical protein